jgi:hypothetical protein
MATTRSYRLFRLRLQQELAESVRRAERNRLEREAHAAAREAAGQPVIPVEDLAVAMRVDKLDAAAQLARLNERQLVRQATAYAAYLNELYQFAGERRAYDSERVLANFQHGIAVWRASRVEGSDRNEVVDDAQAA